MMDVQLVSDLMESVVRLIRVKKGDPRRPDYEQMKKVLKKIGQEVGATPEYRDFELGKYGDRWSVAEPRLRSLIKYVGEF